ncbi:M56 family metallopeptidase [Aurantiacibacter gangjinensis]|uniref:M56 family metallopeptidase n=1 Tax=Aurantiacibacter gangjinensis TaxID=502682 RepID=UPI00069C078C|nr:M56 family metallopeptidase [Aurantiacibacter gangjinensis]APE28541.1 Regulatory sensor-transducer, BlaR1/MecR1 family [Aurantiacibacter gangjinensis]
MSALGDIALADWLVDTFIYTALLIGLVLLVRRPVTRHFGPQVAYALWALPFLRFIMPPIVLPAWMAPTSDPLPAAEAAAEPLVFILSDPAPSAPIAAEVAAAAPAAAPVVGIAVTDLLLPLWIGGALLFIGWRIREYRRMREALLADAVPVGEAGKVRLVETPAVSGPVAFGVLDKVVALPPAFMAHHDIKARDMAIAHELAHHRGHDLVANFAAQPLLALHWFNPLAWWGWRAMRADQEAACDARVVAGRAQSERVTYAQIIAGFATGDDLALAAPMACPVLGEKSIIHRLRSLTLTDISARRRRIGIAAIAATALALPLTASITYAQAEAPAALAVPVGTSQPSQLAQPLESVDPDAQPLVEVEQDEDRDVRRVTRVYRDGEWLSEEETEAEMAALEEELGALEIHLEGMEEEIERTVALAMRSSERAMELHGEQAAQVEMSCENADETGVSVRELGDGRQAVIVCQRNIHRFALSSAETGVRAAMESIRTMESIPREEREETLREMQEALDEMREELREAAEDRQAALRIEGKASLAAAQNRARHTGVAARWVGRMVSPVSVQPATLRVRTVPAAAPARSPVVTPAALHIHDEADCDGDTATRA